MRAQVLALVMSVAAAQADAAPRTAGLVVSLRTDAVRDDLLVPLTFTGPGVRLSGFFEGLVGPGLLVTHASLGFAALFNRFGQLAATLDYGVDAAWLLPLATGATWRLSLGPMVAWDTRVNYFYSWDDAHAYWLGTQWLGPAATLTARLWAGWHLEAAASVAVLGFEGRPPTYRFTKQEAVDHVAYYFAAPLQSEAFVSLAQLHVVRLAVALRPGTALAPGWSFGLDARLAHTDLASSNLNLSVALFAARAWGTP